MELPVLIQPSLMIFSDIPVETLDLPPLPTEGLPQLLLDIIDEGVKVYGLPRDIWTGAFLSAISLAIGSRFIVQTKYINSAMIWLAIVVPSGVGKTHPMDFALKPLQAIEAESYKQYRIELEEYERIINLSADERKEAKIENPERPRWKQLTVSDATPEAITEIHFYNPNGIVVYRDELHGWVLDFGRYGNSGEVQNWLSIWSQQPIKVNRKGKEPLLINDPFINIIGGLQPELLPELAKDNRAYNGFMQRFLFVYPDQVSKCHYSNDHMSPHLVEQYARFINDILEFPAPETPIKLSIDAERRYEEFYNKNADLINKEETGYLRAAFAKLDIIALRIALILHIGNMVSTGDTSNLVSLSTMEAAISMTEYFRLTAVKVFGELNEPVKNITKKDVIFFLVNVAKKSQAEIARVMGVTAAYISKLKREWLNKKQTQYAKYQ